MSQALAVVRPEPIDEAAVLRVLRLNPNDPATQALILTCQRYGLDPILKHAVLISGRLYVTRDGLLHVAHASGQLDGIEVLEQTETPDHWIAKVAVYRKDMSRPFAYVGRYPKAGSGNKAYGPEMAVKCAEVMALRRAFDVAVAAREEAWDTPDENVVAPDGLARATQDDDSGPTGEVPADVSTGKGGAAGTKPAAEVVDELELERRGKLRADLIELVGTERKAVNRLNKCNSTDYTPKTSTRATSAEWQRAIDGEAPAGSGEERVSEPPAPISEEASEPVSEPAGVIQPTGEEVSTEFGIEEAMLDEQASPHLWSRMETAGVSGNQVLRLVRTMLSEAHVPDEQLPTSQFQITNRQLVQLIQSRGAA